MYFEGPSFWGLEQIYWKQETLKHSLAKRLHKNDGNWLSAPIKIEQDPRQYFGIKFQFTIEHDGNWNCDLKMLGS